MFLFGVMAGVGSKYSNREVVIMSRRGENIRKRRDGRWEGRLIVGYDTVGKARYHSVYGHSYQEVKKKKSLFIKACKNKNLCSDENRLDNLPLTFSRITDEWLNSRKDAIKGSTYAQYSFMIDKYILPQLGNRMLSALSSDLLNEYLKNLLRFGRADGKGGLSPKTVSDIRSILMQVIGYAKELNYSCPADLKIFYPKKRQPDIEVLTKAEQNRLEQILFQSSDPIRLGIILSLYGGLRIGEVCALQWGDFNYTAGTVKISKTVMRIKNMTPNSFKKTRVIIDRPKTEHSYRTIPLPSFIMDILIPENKASDCYILSGTTNYIEPRICLKQYKQVLKEAGLRSFTFHALRHTFATRCVENGFDIKALSEILGHANVSTTLQRYVHPSMECKREQMERLGKISIWGQKKGMKKTETSDYSSLSNTDIL